MSKYLVLFLVFVSVGCEFASPRRTGSTPTPLRDGTNPPETPPESPPLPTPPAPEPSPVVEPSPAPPRQGSGSPIEKPGVGDCVNTCKYWFWEGYDGRKVDESQMGKCHKPDDPISLFQGGGTQNWPVNCRAALYMYNGDNTWFKNYFEIQKLKREPNVGVGFGGTELFSPIYMPQTVGGILAVHNEARRRSDSVLTKLTYEWLGAYWSFLALVSEDTKINRALLYFDEKKNPNELTPIFGYEGLSLGLAGTRAGPEWGPGSLNHMMMTLALNWKNRNFVQGIRRDFGIGLRYMIEANGFRATSSNSFDLMQADIEPHSIGLNYTNRAAINSFVSTRGVGLQKLKALIGNFKPPCTYTFLRTTGGVISWLGTSSADGKNCNGNKPPFFAVSLTADGNAQYLFPEQDKVGSPAGRTWRNGQKICAFATSANRQDCIDIPQGNVIYEVSVTPENGFTCVQGDCN